MTYQDFIELTAQSIREGQDGISSEISAFMATSDCDQDGEPALEYCIANHLV